MNTRPRRTVLKNPQQICGWSRWWHCWQLPDCVSGWLGDLKRSISSPASKQERSLVEWPLEKETQWISWSLAMLKVDLRPVTSDNRPKVTSGRPSFTHTPISKKKKKKCFTSFMKFKIVAEKKQHILTCFESLSGLHTAIFIGYEYMVIISLQYFIFLFALFRFFKFSLTLFFRKQIKFLIYQECS